MTVKERSKKKAKTDCRLYQFAHINDNISVTWYRTRLNGIWILEFNISTSIHFERDNFIRLFASFWYCIYLNGLWTVFSLLLLFRPIKKCLNRGNAKQNHYLIYHLLMSINLKNLNFIENQ